MTRLNLLLSTTTTRGDMIEVYKIISNIYDERVPIVLNLRQNATTRGSKTKKIMHEFSSTNIRHNFFSLRVCKMWNSIPIAVIEANNVNTFKNRLDKYWGNRAFRY